MRGRGRTAAAPTATPATPVAPPPPPAPVAVTVTSVQRAGAPKLAAGLGGAGNIVTVEPVALTRLRVQLRQPQSIDERALEAAGAAGVQRVAPDVVHVIVGAGAEGWAAAIEEANGKQ